MMMLLALTATRPPRPADGMTVNVIKKRYVQSIRKYEGSEERRTLEGNKSIQPPKLELRGY